MTVIHTNSFVEEQKGVEWLLLLIQAGKWSFSFRKSASNKSLLCGPFFLSVDLSKSIDHGTLLKGQSFCFPLWEEWKTTSKCLYNVYVQNAYHEVWFWSCRPKTSIHPSFVFCLNLFQILFTIIIAETSLNYVLKEGKWFVISFGC